MLLLRHIHFILDFYIDSNEMTGHQRSNILLFSYKKVKNSLIYNQYIYEKIEHNLYLINYISYKLFAKI